MSTEMIFTTAFNLLVCTVMVVYVRHLVKRETNASAPAIQSVQPAKQQFMHYPKRVIFRTIFATLLVAVIGFSLLPSNVRAQVSSWVAVGNGDTKYMDGNVGIGRAPYAGVKLHIDGGDAWIWNNGNNPGILIGDNANSGNWGSIRWDSTDKVLEMGHQADTDLLTLGNRVDIGGHVNIHDDNGAAVINFPATGTYPNLYIRSDDNPDTYEFDSERLFVGGNGNVGIGTVNPQSTLEVNGYLQLDTTNGTSYYDCDEVSERGRMKVNSANGTLDICMNDGWKEFEFGLSGYEIVTKIWEDIEGTTFTTYSSCSPGKVVLGGGISGDNVNLNDWNGRIEYSKPSADGTRWEVKGPLGDFTIYAICAYSGNWSGHYTPSPHGN